ncbi:MAG: phosphatidylserine/phosphatidylglycerophosphate/cardiolipin synthase family protein [Deltaproteobacteria bacterium]|nr:phosphatidylserine/phosphatidylglycerophosphate/cardiolipin synthase family protein [Deltaproteobacteria bacterium]MCB9488948.1 phosphatidylserine/phosphatidylglycerophosphate/cardiolipin synthase family protein [Deltaproteobacteria bacterium]
MFKRCVIVAAPDDVGARVLDYVRRFAPDLERVVTLVGRSPSPMSWIASNPWFKINLPESENDADLAALEAALERWGVPGRVQTHVELGGDALRQAVDEEQADLVVFGPGVFRSWWAPAEWMAATVRSTTKAILWLPVAEALDAPSPHRWLCPFDGSVTKLTPMAPFFREAIDETHHVVLLALGELENFAPEDLDVDRQIVGIRAGLSLVGFDDDMLSVDKRFQILIEDESIDAVLLPLDGRGGWSVVRGFVALRMLQNAKVPLLLVPTDMPEDLPNLDRPTVAAADVFVPSYTEKIRVFIESINLLGGVAPLDETKVRFVTGGEVLGESAVRRGYAEAELGGRRGFLGFGRTRDDTGEGKLPVWGLENKFAAMDAGDARVILFDARLRDEEIGWLRRRFDEMPDRIPAALRMHSDDALMEIRERLINAGFERPRVVDARQVLEQLDTSDIPRGVGRLILARAASRLRSQGVPVEAVIHLSPEHRESLERSEALEAHDPTDAELETSDEEAATELSTESSVDPSSYERTHPIRELGLSHWTIEEVRVRSAKEWIAAMDQEYRAPTAPRDEAAARRARMDQMTDSALIAGNSVDFELNNHEARRRLIEAIDGARERVHYQVYIVHDDPVAQEIEAALIRAAQRGVAVRFLVDSLYSLHGSFSVVNPLLKRLQSTDGIRMVISNPIEGLPSIRDLKQRDHRKVVVIDNRVAVVTGRNMAASYYQGFDEVKLTCETPGASVPWLDAGARVIGPAVEAIEREFLEAWTAQGGEPYEVRPCVAAGASDVRVVVHQGLQDTHTLDAYLAIIDGAESRLTIVNTFPYQFDVQAALLRAIERGVEVRILFGNVRPLWGAQGDPFPGGAIRELASDVIHGRIDTLVDAGGRGFEFTHQEACWDEAVGRARPHVHAKVVSADGRICAVGSANLDITAGYWESEILLVIENADDAQRLEAQLEKLIEQSREVQRDDPVWRERATQRAWISKNWPSILG